MKRTITMNLNGTIFHIEEDAYDQLHHYLSAIKGYFNETNGRDEIMGDIEARIAEMLQEKVSAVKQAILLTDVEQVIAVMGKPEDFSSGNDQTTFSEKATTIEPRYRRLFRDSDDKVLSGVCSGIAHYFNIDPIWLRALFAIAFFVFGSGFLLYLILWIIIPEAKTTSEKLQMRGEKVDINNIGKAVSEEIDDLKKRMNKFGKEFNTPEYKEHLRNTGRSLSHSAGAVIYSIFTFLKKTIAIILLIVGVVLLTSILAALFGKSNFIYQNNDSHIQLSFYEIITSFFPNDFSPALLITTLSLLFGVPLLFVIYSMIKVIFNIRTRNSVINYIAGILWIVGISLAIYLGMNCSFAKEISIKEKISIIQPANNTLYLDTVLPAEDEEEYDQQNNIKIILNDWKILSKENNQFRLGYPRLDIIPSETDSFQLVIIRSANGVDKKQATAYAKNISYNFSQKDSLLFFNPYYDIPESDKFRNQRVKLLIKVPVNKHIYLNSRMKHIIYDIANVTNILDKDMVNRKWIMTSKGLSCIDCTGDEATVDNGRHKDVRLQYKRKKDIDNEETE